jgi:DNA primase
MSQYDMSRPVLARVREAADIVAIVGEVITLRKSGRNYMGLCPFHGEKTPSFSVSREKGTYYCFGCKKGGDVIDFVMEIERLTFPEAVERLAERFGVELPPASPESRRKHDEQAQLLEAVEAAQAFFLGHLREDRPRAFLERRGVELDFAAGFGLGYAPAEWRALLDSLQKRFSERSLVGAGLVVGGEQGRVWDRFRDRVTIPIRLSRGKLVAFGGRTLGDDTPKYLNSPETPLFSKSQVLFALDRAVRSFPKSDRAVVVEGYFDCLALHQAGIEEAVATLGTALTEHHARELARRVRHVVVCFDGDAAGRSAARSALRTLLAAQLEVGVMLLPAEQDPDDVMHREGPEAFRRRLDGALSPTDFLLEEMGTGREARRSNLLGALEVVDACPDPVRRFAMRETLAQAAAIPPERLGALAAPRVVASAGSPDPDEPSAGELALLRALLYDLPVDKRGAWLTRVRPAGIRHPAVREILARMDHCAAAGLAIEVFELMSELPDGDARRLVASLVSVPETGEDQLREILPPFDRREVKQRLADITQQIREAERSGDEDALARLKREASELYRDLARS